MAILKITSVERLSEPLAKGNIHHSLQLSLIIMMTSSKMNKKWTASPLLQQILQCQWLKWEVHGESNQICIGYWAFKRNYNTKHLHFQWNIDIYSVSIKHMTVWNGTVTMATRSLWKFGINKEILPEIPILRFEVKTPSTYILQSLCTHTSTRHKVDNQILYVLCR